jgi:pimeloyl-ACP methyl ester carboxylesterase
MPYPASKIHYAPSGHGPPLLLIHGNPATHTLWRPVAGLLEAGRTVYAIDLPGFGGSPPPQDRAGFRLQSLARIILDWADLVGLETFDLAGHSFGAAVAATIADIAPGRVRSLSLLTPLGDLPPPAGRLATSLLARTVLPPLWRVAPGPLRQWVARRGARVSYGTAFTDVRAREVAGENDRPIALDSMAGVMAGVNYDEYRVVLRRLNDTHSMPLLIVGARRDGVIPFAHFERLQGILTRARCTVFDDGGHVPIWQYPEEVARLLSGIMNYELNA